MTRPTVVITHWVHDEVIALLEQSCAVIPNLSRETLPRAEILRRCVAADGLLAFMPDCIDQEFLDACPRLKVIGAALKGYDNFDVSACRQRGISFSIVNDLLTEPTAELAVGLLIGLGRQILAGDRLLRAGQFQGWRPILYGKGLSGSTVGIIGMGAIGRAVAARLAGFGCQLLYTDPVTVPTLVAEELCVREVALPELLAVSDFILIAAPLNGQTFHLIDDAALARMKQGVYLVNIGRGSVVDEAAVVRALASGRLAGYAADVFAFEDWARRDRPEQIEPALLACADRTLLTPHLGSAVDSVRREIALEAAGAIVSVFAAESLTGDSDA